MALIGYVRVSTDKQTVMQQLDALRAAGCKRIFREQARSATSRDRPALRAARIALKPGDTFIVSSIDRAFRSTMEAIVFLDDVMREGITFRSLSQHIDTRTPEGRKWYIDTANAAEYERAVISRRTRERMAAAKRRGQSFGRPRKLSGKQVAWARRAIGKHPPAEIARRLEVSPRTLNRALSAPREVSCRG